MIMIGDNTNDIIIKQRQKANEIIARITVGSDSLENTLKKIKEVLECRARVENEEKVEKRGNNAITRN